MPALPRVLLALPRALETSAIASLPPSIFLLSMLLAALGSLYILHSATTQSVSYILPADPIRYPSCPCLLLPPLLLDLALPYLPSPPLLLPLPAALLAPKSAALA